MELNSTTLKINVYSKSILKNILLVLLLLFITNIFYFHTNIIKYFTVVFQDYTLKKKTFIQMLTLEYYKKNKFDSNVNMRIL